MTQVRLVAVHDHDRIRVPLDDMAKSGPTPVELVRPFLELRNALGEHRAQPASVRRERDELRLHRCGCGGREYARRAAQSLQEIRDVRRVVLRADEEYSYAEIAQTNQTRRDVSPEADGEGWEVDQTSFSRTRRVSFRPKNTTTVRVTTLTKA